MHIDPCMHDADSLEGILKKRALASPGAAAVKVSPTHPQVRAANDAISHIKLSSDIS